jgi:hypothetical protein
MNELYLKYQCGPALPFVGSHLYGRVAITRRCRLSDVRSVEPEIAGNLLAPSFDAERSDGIPPGGAGLTFAGLLPQDPAGGDPAHRPKDRRLANARRVLDGSPKKSDFLT